MFFFILNSQGGGIAPVAPPPLAATAGDRTALQPSGIETLTPREMPDQYIIVSSMMGLESTIYLSLDQ